MGRLGVISELTLKIMPQMAVERKLQELEFDAFVQQIREAQADYVAAKEAGDVDGMKQALYQACACAAPSHTCP